MILVNDFIKINYAKEYIFKVCIWKFSIIVNIFKLDSVNNTNQTIQSYSKLGMK